jgi:hypothetical protein
VVGQALQSILFLKQFSDNVMKGAKICNPEDPISTVTGMLKHVKKTGVQLQHEASRYELNEPLALHDCTF